MSLAEFEVLDRAHPFWESRGFSAWSAGSLGGVYRRMTIRKSSILGEIASYYTDDYILWRHNGEADRDRVLRTWRPAPDLMVQRVVFLENTSIVPRRKTRSFLLGLRGFIEVYCYSAGGRPQRGIEDLATLIDQAMTETTAPVGRVQG
ncbi:MAG TPA: hypothetical protein VMZ06_06370 [Candidatus Bathyarchaeia archaeon]|nr:hypothetical protein [Candidatus Bathyarchaeia archaeon]